MADHKELGFLPVSLGYDSYVSSEPLEAKVRDEELPTERPKHQYGVLVIDMQNSFLKHISPKDKDEMVSAQTNLLKFCREYDVPIVTLEWEDLWENAVEDTIPELKATIDSVPRHIYSQVGLIPRSLLR